jgi:hypothetical protein
VVGTLTLSRTNPGDESSTDYLALVQDMERVIHASLYDPQQADTSDMRGYLTDLREGAVKVHDDIEFLLVEAITARAFPKLVAGFLYPKPDQREELAMSGIANPVTPYQIKRDERTTTIRFDAILDENEIDEAFELALKDSPEAIILDLRKAAGLDVGSLRMLSWIARSPVNAGIFVGRTDRVAVLNGALPATLTLDSAQDFENLRSRLGAGQSADVWVAPRPDAFRGPVAVLIGKRSSGSTEAAIAAIRSAMIAPTFGEPTAGKPLVSYEFDVGTPDPRGQAWVTRLPVAEFVSPDRRSIMDSGVEPDAAVRGNALVEAATRWIEERLNDHTWDADAWFEASVR